MWVGLRFNELSYKYLYFGETLRKLYQNQYFSNLTKLTIGPVKVRTFGFIFSLGLRWLKFLITVSSMRLLPL